MNSLPCLGYLSYSRVRDKAIPWYFKAAVTRTLCRDPATQIRYLQRQRFSVTQVFCFHYWLFEAMILFISLNHCICPVSRVNCSCLACTNILYYFSPSTVPIYPLLPPQVSLHHQSPPAPELRSNVLYGSGQIESSAWPKSSSLYKHKEWRAELA